MGVVYKALDTRLQRTVAIKMLPPEFAVNEKKKKRLMREAQAASSLNHPNICTIHDIDEADGSIFLVMEYLTGSVALELLKEVKRRGFPNVDWMARDPDLAILHDDPEFKLLIEIDPELPKRGDP